MWKIASPSSPPLVALIQDVLRASPDAAWLRTQESEEIQSPIGLGAGEMDVALSDTEKYPQIFMGTLGYAIFPHTRSPLLAKSFGIAKRDMAWGWIAG